MTLVGGTCDPGPLGMLESMVQYMWSSTVGHAEVDGSEWQLEDFVSSCDDVLPADPRNVAVISVPNTP